MTDLCADVAHIKRITPRIDQWLAGTRIGFATDTQPHIGTILKAAASGALVPVEDVQGLVEAARRIRATAQEGFRTADFHYAECSCPRCAEDALMDALTAWENRND